MPHFDNPFGAQTELTDASAGISYRQNGERMAFAARAFCTSAGVITDGSLIFVNTLSKKFLKLRPAQPSGLIPCYYARLWENELLCREELRRLE